MTLTLADAPEVAALPVAATAPPASIERVTPLRTALGLADQAGSGVMLQAETLVCAHPASPIALARLAQAAQAAGQHDQACEAARAAIEAAGQLADPRRGRHAVYAAALVLAAHGQEDSAAALAGSGLPGASIARAGISAQAGQLELALQQLAGSDSPLADAMRGWLLLQSAPSEGVRALRAAVKGGLRTPEVLVNLGYGLAAVGALRKAVDVTREATYLAPALTVAAYNLTSFLHRQRRDGTLSPSSAA